MKVKLVAIGNSKGVRIPKSIIRECGFGDEVEMRVREGAVVLAPVRTPRDGWNEAFAEMAATGDDAPLVPEPVVHAWDEEEWEW